MLGQVFLSYYYSFFIPKPIRNSSGEYVPQLFDPDTQNITINGGNFSAEQILQSIGMHQEIRQFVSTKQEINQQIPSVIVLFLDSNNRNHISVVVRPGEQIKGKEWSESRYTASAAKETIRRLLSDKVQGDSFELTSQHQPIQPATSFPSSNSGICCPQSLRPSPFPSSFPPPTSTSPSVQMQLSPISFIITAPSIGTPSITLSVPPLIKKETQEDRELAAVSSLTSLMSSPIYSSKLSPPSTLPITSPLFSAASSSVLSFSPPSPNSSTQNSTHATHGSEGKRIRISELIN